MHPSQVEALLDPELQAREAPRQEADLSGSEPLVSQRLDHESSADRQEPAEEGSQDRGPQGDVGHTPMP